MKKYICEVCRKNEAQTEWSVPARPKEYYERILASVNGIVPADAFDRHDVCWNCCLKMEDDPSIEPEEWRKFPR